MNHNLTNDRLKLSSKFDRYTNFPSKKAANIHIPGCKLIKKPCQSCLKTIISHPPLQNLEWYIEAPFSMKIKYGVIEY